MKWTALASVILGLIATVGRVDTHGQAAKPVLYVTATAHLDSQWNWTVQDTIRQYVPSTFYTNFKFLDEYPDYTFTYEGAIHYMWFKEYHPDDWPTLQKVVANGRWRLAGSWIDAVDTNIPSPESLMRQALYGQHFFRQEFGKVSRDVYLPDCFGFGFALPSIAVHSGLQAFTTQKLTWGSSVPIPFPVGRWRGVDGSEVVANLNPGDYVTKITSDISVDPKWSNDLTPIGAGAKVGFRLFGTGDIGGGPDANSLDWLEKSLANKNGVVEVRNTSADQLSRDLTPAERASLPVYEGELTMQTHGVGCYTSQAAMKRFNRENEILADAAERAGVAAQYVAAEPYPTDRLREAWTRVLWHQFHDDLTGTCIPQAYQFSWNDELSAANQFAGVLTHSTAAVAGVLDTTGTGVPLVVYNPLSMTRHDLVEADVTFPGAVPARVGVVDRATGQRVVAQTLGADGHRARIIFPADVPSVGFKVFGVEAAAAPGGQPGQSKLSATPTSIENDRYTVKIDDNGDIASIYDRASAKELLRAPIRLEMRDDPSPDKPAWRILYSTINAPVRQFPMRPRTRVVESGPWRAVVEISRQAARSTIIERVSLVRGGDRVDVDTSADWKSTNTLLKAAFPFAASNPKATYDLGLGTIQRGNDTEKAYEVPAQEWADITDASGSFGAAVLNDSKYGWDKPADNVLRLTLLHTPLPRASPYQSSNDLGHHHFVYSVVGHRGDWRDGQVPSRAAELNQPLIAFQTDSHGAFQAEGAGRNDAFSTARRAVAAAGARSLSLASTTDTSGEIAIRALKKAEDSDEVVVRLQEQFGRPAKTTLTLAGAVESVREINAAEEPIGPLSPTGGAVVLDFKPYQPRTIAVVLRTRQGVPTHAAAPIVLPFNLDGVSTDGHFADGDFDGKGHTISGDLLPRDLLLDGVPFVFGSSAPGAMNVLVPHGQTLPLPAGGYDRVYLVAAAVGGNVPTAVTAGGKAQSFTVHEWEGAIGQWDSRLKEPGALREPFVPAARNGTPSTAEIRDLMLTPWDPRTFGVAPADIDRIRPGFVTRDEIAWIGTHRHAPDGNQVYIMSYLFKYTVDVPPGTRAIALPDDGRLRILAVTAARGPAPAWPTRPLFASDLHEPPALRPQSEKRPAGR
jgi:alpha-mannosidase